MQLNTMDCTTRTNINGRHPDLGDELSHDDHSDDELQDCDSIENNHINGMGSRLNTSSTSTNSDMNGHDHANDIAINHRHSFPTNHPLNALGNFMNLRGIPNLQHNDVLEKLKMQVRDMNVGLMDQDYAVAHASVFGSNAVPTPRSTAFSLPPTTMASYTHAGHNPNARTQAGGNMLNSNYNPNSPSLPSSGVTLSNGNHNNFSFTSPPAPSTRDANAASGSSTSSETSNSSQQNGWSFEEQYKQVRQLYDLTDEPERKEFLDDLFSFMQNRGSPITRLPIMAKSVLDLYELYNLVIARGGLVAVINKKLWQEIIKGLRLPSSITSAAFTLRTQYMKFLYPYECAKKKLSTPSELQTAIDGNRREGRRSSSYNQLEALRTLQPQLSNQALASSMQQVGPLALVGPNSSPQVQAAAVAAQAAHAVQQGLLGGAPFEHNMLEYLRVVHATNNQNPANGPSTSIAAQLQLHQQHLQIHQQLLQQEQQQGQESQNSPEINPREALTALSRAALLQMCHNNISRPASAGSPPLTNGILYNGASSEGLNESQHSEALNLSEARLNVSRRSRCREPSPVNDDDTNSEHQPPPPKRSHDYPANDDLPSTSSAAAAAAAALRNLNSTLHQAPENGLDNYRYNSHNTSGSSSSTDCNGRRSPSANGINNIKSEDSSQGGSSLSPTNMNAIVPQSSQAPLDLFNLLSSMQFQVARRGVSINGEQELLVSLEVNHVKYSGCLIANSPPNLRMIQERPAASNGNASINGNGNSTSQHSNHLNSDHEDNNDNDDNDNDQNVNSVTLTGEESDSETNNTAVAIASNGSKDSLNTL